MANPCKISVSYHEIGPAEVALDARKLEKWLLQVSLTEGYSLDHLGLIICDDAYLIDLNQRYLNHDTLTDIITFDYGRDEVLTGECYISLERVRENALKFEVSLNDELHRVVVHGFLHLCGYLDKSDQDKEVMRAKENTYLALRN